LQDLQRVSDIAIAVSYVTIPVCVWVALYTRSRTKYDIPKSGLVYVGLFSAFLLTLAAAHFVSAISHDEPHSLLVPLLAASAITCVVTASFTPLMVRRLVALPTRAQVASEVRKATQLFERAFEDAGHGMAILSLEGKWVRVNRQVENITGYTAKELCDGMSYQDITPEPYCSEDEGYTVDLLEGRIPRYTMEKPYELRDGSWRWINLSVSLIRDDFGKPAYFLSQLIDIDAEKRARERQQRSRAEAQALIERQAAYIGKLNELSSKSKTERMRKLSADIGRLYEEWNITSE
jgi:PAS domain S-box-containing protein